MEITKVTKKVYKVSNAVTRPFMKFGRFREVREMYGMKVQRNCFNCNKKFINDDDIYLVATTGGNKLLCGKCNDIALNDLKEKGD